MANKMKTHTMFLVFILFLTPSIPLYPQEIPLTIKQSQAIIKFDENIKKEYGENIKYLYKNKENIQNNNELIDINVQNNNETIAEIKFHQNISYIPKAIFYEKMRKCTKNTFNTNKTGKALCSQNEIENIANDFINNIDLIKNLKENELILLSEIKFDDFSNWIITYKRLYKNIEFKNDGIILIMCDLNKDIIGYNIALFGIINDNLEELNEIKDYVVSEEKYKNYLKNSMAKFDKKIEIGEINFNFNIEKKYIINLKDKEPIKEEVLYEINQKTILVNSFKFDIFDVKKRLLLRGEILVSSETDDIVGMIY
jgi:hypothetical protein